MVAVLLPHIDVKGMMWSFAGLYLMSAGMALYLKLPVEVAS